MDVSRYTDEELHVLREAALLIVKACNEAFFKRGVEARAKRKAKAIDDLARISLLEPRFTTARRRMSGCMGKHKIMFIGGKKR